MAYLGLSPGISPFKNWDGLVPVFKRLLVEHRIGLLPGAMLSQARLYLRKAWWITTFPGLAIMLSVFSINLIGDALRDALDPQLRGALKD